MCRRTSQAFFHAIAPQYHVRRWYWLPLEVPSSRTSLWEGDRVMTVYAWERCGQTQERGRRWHFAHDQSCPGDQEFTQTCRRDALARCRLLSHAGSVVSH